MKPVLEGWNATLVGVWNLAILSPEWLSKYLFQNQKVKVEVPVGGVGFLRITGDRVRILTSPSRLQISPVELNDDALLQVERVATTLLSELKHTPITAVGVNFAFAESAPEEGLLDHLRDPDTARLVDLNFRLDAVTWTRHLQAPEGHVLNFSVRRDPASVQFEFNFHRDVSSTDAAVGALQNHILGYRASALGILETVFGLQQEVDDGEA